MRMHASLILGHEGKLMAAFSLLVLTAEVVAMLSMSLLTTVGQL